MYHVVHGVQEGTYPPSLALFFSIASLGSASERGPPHAPPGREEEAGGEVEGVVEEGGSGGCCKGSGGCCEGSHGSSL